MADQQPAPGSGPERRDREDPRPDIQQVVEARADAVARGEGGPEPDPMTSPGDFTGHSGEGGVTKNQDLTAQ